VRGLEQPAPHVEQNLGHRVVKVIKREKNQAITLAVGRNAENKEMADSVKVLHSRRWERSRHKRVYCYCASDIFGSQLFDH